MLQIKFSVGVDVSPGEDAAVIKLIISININFIIIINYYYNYYYYYN